MDRCLACGTGCLGNWCEPCFEMKIMEIDGEGVIDWQDWNQATTRLQAAERGGK